MWTSLEKPKPKPKQVSKQTHSQRGAAAGVVLAAQPLVLLVRGAVGHEGPLDHSLRGLGEGEGPGHLEHTHRVGVMSAYAVFIQELHDVLYRFGMHSRQQFNISWIASSGQTLEVCTSTLTTSGNIIHSVCHQHTSDGITITQSLLIFAGQSCNFGIF